MSLCRSELMCTLSTRRPTLPRVGWLCAAGLSLVLPAALGQVRLGVVTGHSMEPTLQPWQPFLFERCSEMETLQRGDLVVVRMGGEICIKRVYALGADRFWSASPPGNPGGMGSLIGVGDPLNLWKARFPRFRYRERRVPSRCIFVVGDAPSRSVDSRQLGPVPVSQVVGRVVWPQEPIPPAGGPINFWSDQPRHPRSKAVRISS